jgi:hypothetical protein
MPDQPRDRRPHLVLANTSTAQAFTAPSSGGRPSAVPVLERAQHGNALKAQLLALHSAAQQAVAAQTEQGLESGLGLQIEFVGQPDAALAFDSLGSERGADASNWIEVLSVRVEGDTTYANVFVPDGKLAHFSLIVSIRTPETDVDLYTPIAQQVAAQAAVPVVVTI